MLLCLQVADELLYFGSNGACLYRYYDKTTIPALGTLARGRLNRRRLLRVIVSREGAGGLLGGA
jgi:hypothetical protein